MKLLMIVGAFLFLNVLSASTAVADEVKCTAGADERLLKIVESEGGCSLEYTKGGSTSTIATQKVGTEKCEEIREKVKSKLTDAGYSCPTTN